MSVIWVHYVEFPNNQQNYSVGKNYFSKQVLHTNTILITMAIPQVVSNKEGELLVHSCIPSRNSKPQCPFFFMHKENLFLTVLETRHQSPAPTRSQAAPSEGFSGGSDFGLWFLPAGCMSPVFGSHAGEREIQGMHLGHVCRRRTLRMENGHPSRASGSKRLPSSLL